MNELWEKACRAATGARILFGAEDYEGAASRAYYAMFNAARALLIASGSKAAKAKSHASVIRTFSEQFVRGGPFAEADGRALRQASDVRNLADYQGAPLGPERVQAVLKSMEQFMAVAEGEIGKFEGRGGG